MFFELSELEGLVLKVFYSTLATYVYFSIL